VYHPNRNIIQHSWGYTKNDRMGEVTSRKIAVSWRGPRWLHNALTLLVLAIPFAIVTGLVKIFLWQHQWLMITVLMLAFGAVQMGLVVLLPRMWTTSTRVLINSNGEGVGCNDLLYSLALANTLSTAPNTGAEGREKARLELMEAVRTHNKRGVSVLAQP